MAARFIHSAASLSRRDNWRATFAHSGNYPAAAWSVFNRSPRLVSLNGRARGRAHFNSLIAVRRRLLLRERSLGVGMACARSSPISFVPVESSYRWQQMKRRRKEAAAARTNGPRQSIRIFRVTCWDTMQRTFTRESRAQTHRTHSRASAPANYTCINVYRQSRVWLRTYVREQIALG